MSFTSGSGPIATAFVAITLNTDRAEAQADRFVASLSGSLRRIDDIAQRAGEDIEDSFREAALASDRILRDIGGPELFATIEAQAEAAGEDIENSFAESQRQSDDQLQQIGGVGTFTPAVVGAERAADRIERSFRGASISSRAHLGAISIGLFGLTGALAVAGGAVVGFGLTQAAALEQTQIAFEALLGSAEEADAFIREMQEFAATTPFEFVDLTNAARQLLATGQAAGITREEIIPTVTVFGDLISVLGQNANEAMPRIIRAFGQMASRGRATTEEMLQLAEALPGFPVFQVLADGLGVATSELQELISSGAVPAQQAIDILIEGMRDFPGAAGAMAEQARTLTGVFSTFKDTVSLALTESFQPLVPVVVEQLGAAIPAIEAALGTIGPALSGIAETLLTVISGIVAELGPTFGNVLQGLSNGLATIASAVGPALGPLSEALRSLAPVFVFLGEAIAPIIALFATLISTVIPPLAEVLGGLINNILTPLIEIFSGVLVGAIEAFAPVLAEVADVLTEAFAVLGPILSEVAEIMAGSLADAFQTLAPVLAEVVTILGAGLQEVLVALAPSIREIASALAERFTASIEAIVPVLPQLAEAFVTIALALADILVALLPLLPAFIELETLIIEEIGAPLLVELSEAIAAMAEAFAELTVALIPVLVPLVNLVTLLITSALGPLLNLIGEAVVFLASALAPLAPLIVTLASPVFLAITVFTFLWQNVLVPLGSFLTGVFNVVWQTLGTIFDTVIVPAVQFVNDAFTTLWQVVLVPLFGFIEAVVIPILRVWLLILVGPLLLAIIGVTTAATFLWNNVLVPFASFLAAVFGPVLETIANFLSGAFNLAITVVTTAASFLWNNVLVPFGSFLASVFRGALNTARDGWNFLRDAIDRIVGVVQTVRNVALTPLINLLRNTVTPVVDAFKSAWDAVRRAIERAIDVIEDIIDVARDAADAVGDFLGSLPGAGVAGDIAGFINPFQHGGIITQDQLGLLHAPEVVIPLNEPQRALELARRSGLLDILAEASPSPRSTAGGAGSFTGAPGFTIDTVNVNIVNPANEDAGRRAGDAFISTIQRRQIVLTARTV